MFSSVVAQAHRTVVIFWFLVMAFVVSPSPHSSFSFRRRDQPRLLPDKMIRSWDLTPAVLRIGGSYIPGNDSSSANGRKKRENLLPSNRIRSDESRQFGVRDLYDDPHAGEVRPISVSAAPDVTHVRSRQNPQGVKLLRNDPRLIGLVAYHIV
jgi:hypothetical protein